MQLMLNTPRMAAVRCTGMRVTRHLLAATLAIGTIAAATTPSTGKQLPENEARPPTGTPWDRFLEILQEHHIPHDVEELEEAALRAMVHAIDRQAALVTREEAETLRLREAGFAPPDPSPESPDDSRHAEEPAALPPLQVEHWPRNLAYIKINGLYENAGDRFSESVSNLKTGENAGLIIDVRNAGGRDFDAVDRIAAYFVEDDTPLYTLEAVHGGILRRGIAEKGFSLAPTPTLLLTDNRTMQAAELLAAILREANGVMVLGERTRGDPTLRELYRWSEDKYLYLPSAVIRPEETHDYKLVGIVPHITVDRVRRRFGTETTVAADDPENTGYPALENAFPDIVDRDPVLRRAVDILIGLQTIGNQ